MEDGSESDDEFVPRVQRDLERPGRLNKHPLTRNSQDRQLLPGLPNELVLEEIVPKLSWRVFHILSQVNLSWKQAVQNHEVYDARVRSHSNETLLVCNHRFKADENHLYHERLSLYSVRDKSWLQLPYPDGRGCSFFSSFVSLDGKIYVLGRLSMKDIAFKEVYVLDLAGHREWKQCADMLETRFNYLSGVINDKIYVFGNNLYEGENIQVYDTKEDTWSLVESTKSIELGAMPSAHVVTVGDELFVDIGFSSWQAERDAEIYHPRRNEWRRDKEFQFSNEGGLFTAHGKLHRMTSSGIDVYHADGNLWTRLHSIQALGNEWTDDPLIFVVVVEAHDQLFVLADCINVGLCLFQGKGFGNEGEQILWQKVNCPFAIEMDSTYVVHPFMCTIQL